MRVLLLLLICLLYASCEKASDKREDDCGDAVIKQLGLLAEPSDDDDGCVLSATLRERDGTLFYEISGPLCFIVPEIYTCDGTQVCQDIECRQAFTRKARFIKVLGYLPPVVDCGDDIVARLGLQEDIPSILCPNRYDLLLVDGTYFYRVTNIGPGCNSVIQILSCDGTPVCIDAPNDDCYAPFDTDSVYVRLLGYR